MAVDRVRFPGKCQRRCLTGGAAKRKRERGRERER